MTYNKKTGKEKNTTFQFFDQIRFMEFLSNLRLSTNFTVMLST